MLRRGQHANRQGLIGGTASPTILGAMSCPRIDRPRRAALALPAVLLWACMASGVLMAESWQLPWPDHDFHVPLRNLANWRLPGVCNSAEIARGSLRNTQPEHVLAHHGVTCPKAMPGDDRAILLTMAVRGWPDQAVWVGIGADNLATNGLLDGLECRLMVGLDRGRWGLRGNAMGATVWAPAQLPPAGGVCRIQVEIHPVSHFVRATVEDAGGRRTPLALADFDPDWDLLPADAVAGWQLVRIETRGAQAELVDLSIRRARQGILMVR